MHEVVVYRVPLDVPAAIIAELGDTLSRDERARGERYVIEGPRRRFIVCRGVLRRVLGELTDLSPADVRFQYQRSGKPGLAATSTLHFNVSHSQEQALIGIARTPLGIDVEIPDTRMRIGTLARQVLASLESAATDHMQAVELDATILDLWVCKEAMLKALGIGLQGGMHRIAFDIPLVSSDWFAPRWIAPELQLALDEQANCSRHAWLAPATWRLRFLEAPLGGRAAVAVDRRVEQLTVHDIALC